jgi:hypothetical protein
MRRFGANRILTTGALVLWLAAAGCATNGDVSTAQTDASEALRLAQDANQKATLAAADAAAARADAAAAVQEARKASDKSDRIFQRTLQK